MINGLITAGQILASGSDDGDGNIAFLLLFSGVAFYLYVFLRYRNADKRHKHESETKAETLNVQVADQRAGSITGSSSSTMRGANHRKVTGAQQNLLGNAIGSLGVGNITKSLFKR